jgi:hypothetical protein
VLPGVREKSGLIATTAAVKAMQPGGRHTEEGVMNYYDVTQKVQEQREADFLKAMKKNKQFWADPMCYPVNGGK